MVAVYIHSTESVESGRKPISVISAALLPAELQRRAAEVFRAAGQEKFALEANTAKRGLLECILQIGWKIHPHYHEAFCP